MIITLWHLESHRFAKSKTGHLFIVYEWCNRREWSSSARE